LHGIAPEGITEAYVGFLLQANKAEGAALQG
jgi:hypothetical protein